MQDDSLNPNRKRYRLLWQSAYAAIVATIRQNRGVRTEWTKCVFLSIFYFFNSLVVKSYDYGILFSLSLMRQAHECCSINERKRRFHETAR